MSIIVGDGGPNSLAGGPADDTIFGNGGQDTIAGGGGFDTVDFAGTPGDPDLDVDLADGAERGATNTELASGIR